MAEPHARTMADRRVELAGALAVTGLAIAAVTLQHSRRSGTQTSHDKRQALAAYLREHLSGADAAIHLVAHLESAYDGRRDGAIFSSLHQQFLEDRAVVTTLLQELGMSPLSIKRLAGRVTGNVATWVTNGTRGDLSLFRAIEALSIGVQGKRCLWRALQAMDPPLRAPSRRSFADLESRALDQWESLERFRESLAVETFSAY
jgi:hypothetical protein